MFLGFYSSKEVKKILEVKNEKLKNDLYIWIDRLSYISQIGCTFNIMSSAQNGRLFVDVHYDGDYKSFGFPDETEKFKYAIKAMEKEEGFKKKIKEVVEGVMKDKNSKKEGE